jgi:hypothetical protein
MGDLKRRLRAPASPEVVHARKVARQVLAADVSESGEYELTAGLPTPPKTLALVRPETCSSENGLAHAE